MGEERERSYQATVAIAVFAMVLLSAGPVIVKSAEMSGVAFAFWRVVTAAATYYLVARASGRRIGMFELRRSFAGGFFYATNIALFFSALKATSVANATVITSLQTVIVLMLVGPRFFGEKTSRQMFIWSGVATLAVMFFVVAGGESGETSWRGDLLAFGAMVLFVGYYAGSKMARDHLDVLTYSAAFYLVSTILLAPIVLVVEGGVDAPPVGDWVPLGLMVLIPGTGHVLTNYATKTVPLALMSLIIVAGPVVAAGYAFVFLDEGLTAVQLGAMAVVLVAMAIVVTRPRDAVERTA